MVDEVGADSPVRLSELRGWLEVFSNTLRGDNNRYWRDKGGSVAVVMLTSDALIHEIRYMVGGKVNWALIWNLPYNAMRELAGQLQLDLDAMLLWRLTGGNPRALTLIKKLGLKRWLGEEVIPAVIDLIGEARTLPGIDVWRELEVVVEDIDRVRWDIAKLMLKRNIAIYISGVYNSISEIERRLWIGESYALQIPAYGYILKSIVERKSLHIEPEDIVATI